MTDSKHDRNIEKALTNLQPKPSGRFYQYMKTAPWHDNTQHQARTTHFVYGRVAAVATFIIAASLLFTPLGTLAQEFLSQFFTQTPSDTKSSTLTIDTEPTLAADAIFVQPQSLEAVQSEVDFEIGLPQDTRGYVFSDASTNKSGTMTQTLLFYSVPEDTVGRNVVIKQAPASFGFGGIDIGAGATVEIVQIGDEVGEYTRGFWASDVEPTVISEEGSQQVLEVEQIWDNTLGFHFLRWQQDGMAYEIMFQEAPNAMLSTYVSDPTAPGMLTKNDLVAIATSLK